MIMSTIGKSTISYTHIAAVTTPAKRAPKLGWIIKRLDMGEGEGAYVLWKVTIGRGEIMEWLGKERWSTYRIFGAI